MYKTAVLFLFFLTFSLWDASSQKHPQFSHIGAGGGVNFAGIRGGGNYDSFDKNIGVNIGFKGNYSFSDLFSLGAEVCFEQKGAVDEAFDINTNLSYLTLPFYIKWGLGDKSRFFLISGVYGSYLLNAVKKGEKRVDGRYVSVNDDLSDSFRSYDAGIVLGGGVMVELNWDFDFFVSVRTGFGIPDISENQPCKPKNYHFGVNLGYIYYIGFR